MANAQASALPPGLPPQFGKLINCSSVTDPAERLACFDREAANVANSVRRNDLVVVDRAAVRSSKRTLFGLPVPTLGIFGNDQEEIAQIEGVISSVGRNRDGGYLIALADGALWSQTDDRPVAVAPRRGDRVTVKRGALGSYMLSVDRQPGWKVVRVSAPGRLR